MEEGNKGTEWWKEGERRDSGSWKAENKRRVNSLKERTKKKAS